MDQFGVGFRVRITFSVTFNFPGVLVHLHASMEESGETILDTSEMGTKVLFPGTFPICLLE